MSDKGKVGLGRDYGKSKSSLEKGLVDCNDASDVDGKEFDLPPQKGYKRVRVLSFVVPLN